MTAKSVSKYCLVGDCCGQSRARGMCRKHYGRWWKYGDPKITRRLFGVGSTDELFFWSHVAITADATRCWLWQAGQSRGGYGKVGFKGKTYYAHRLAWLWTKGEDISGALILHSCDVRLCVNPNHMRKGTQADNMRDKVLRGRQVRGEQLHSAKFTEQQVIHIKQRLADGEIQSNIAGEFSVHRSTISAINTGKHWKCVLGKGLTK